MMARARLVKIVMGIATLIMTFAMTVGVATQASASTIQQLSPTAGTIDVAGSAGFTADLEVSGNTGAVTYSGSSSPAGLLVSTSGVVTTTGTLAATTYTISGTDSDSSSDTGNWSYTLTVFPDTISQGTPTTGTVDVAGSAGFTADLEVSGNTGGVTYVVTGSSSPTGLLVSSAGVVTTTGTLAATTYTISGTDSDSFGDTGNWSYTLTVTPDTIVQGTPTTASVATDNSANFSTTLSATPGFTDAVAYVVTGASSPSGLLVSSSGVVTTTGTLAATTYTISGSDSDMYGDSGSWSFALSVTQSGTKPTLVQTSPNKGTTTTTASGTYSAGPITVENNVGTVTFVTTASSSGLSVSSSGLISTTGPLAAGTYSVSGTDSDPDGDSGTWTYTLTVTSVPETVTFDANGGSGTMAAETESEPTALSLNAFVWPGHTFVDWNTSADGSGVSYANGAVFPFSESTILFAQWKSGKAPSRTITFVANGGTGSMRSEVDNTPTAISANKFTRAGYKFVDWNTSSRGSGKTYMAGETYPFKKSVTLYAQWKKVAAMTYAVTFIANGGSGKMAPEHGHSAMALNANQFTRSGYTFAGWNTAANGFGVSFSNRATYSFTSSTDLYAQWKKVKKATPPPTKPSGPLVGPFAANSDVLTVRLEEEVGDLANQMKANAEKEVTLVGYGDSLSAAKQRSGSDVTANVALGRSRAQAVATYLEGRLTSMGLKGWTISIAGASPSPSTSSDAALVIATLS